MQIDPIASVDENGNSNEIFDRSIWKDRQEMLQIFDISVRTLARWRDREGLRMRKYKKKYFYHLKDAEELHKKINKKKDWVFMWPISLAWTGFWVAETIFLFVPVNAYEKVFSLAIPLIIVVPADFIIRIRKRRKKK